VATPINLGCHANAESQKEGLEDFRPYTNLFQIFLQTPHRVQMDFDKLCLPAEAVRRMNPDCHFVVHAPFWYNFQAPNKLQKLALKSVKQHLEVCERFGFEYLVTHPGSRRVTVNKDTKEVREYDAEVAFETLTTSLQGVLAGIDGYGVKLLLENMPHCKANTLDTDFILRALAHYKERGLNNIGLCFDTEHAYAHGEQLSDYPRFLEAADLIHFNAVPEGVVYGQGRDRHSETPWFDSAGIEPSLLVEWAHSYSDTYKIMEMDKQPALSTFAWLSSDEVQRITE